MRTIVSAITGVAFLLHLWLGCCAHHAHADEGPAGHEALPAHGDHHDGEHDCPQHAPAAPGNDCDEPDCVFVTTAPTAVSQDLLAWPAWDAAVVADAGQHAPLLSQARSGFDLVFALPLRVHLLHQVFLN